MGEPDDREIAPDHPGLEAVERRLREHVLDAHIEPVKAVILIAQEFPRTPIPELIYVLVTLYDAMEGLPSPDPQKDARLRLRILEEAASLGAELYAMQIMGDPAPAASALLVFREEIARAH